MSHFTGKAVKVFAFSVASALLLAATALAADSAVAAGSISGSSVIMRSSASTSSEIVTTLDKGTSVSILDTSDDDWYKVSYNGKTGYVSADYVAVDQDGSFTAPGMVNSDNVNIRSAASADASVVETIDKGTLLTVTGLQNGWYSVTCQYGTKGFIRSDLVNLTADADDNSNDNAGSKVVTTAKRYLGTRYVYGGSSPSGFDCSGFTMYVYRQYGYSLPHTATGQWQTSVGKKVYSSSNLQTGDLVFFCDPSRSNGKTCSHAGIYIGAGKFIHASSSRSGGVIISSLYENYYSSYYVGGKHIVR